MDLRLQSDSTITNFEVRNLPPMAQQCANTKIAALPEDRLEPAEPFHYCAVDLFGPILIKEGRKEHKRYGVLFTCLSSRAVHIETVNSSTDSFIKCLRRIIAMRGPIRQLRCDQGTNFVGAKFNAFQREYERIDQAKVAQFLKGKGCDIIEFKMNISVLYGRSLGAPNTISDVHSPGAFGTMRHPARR